MASPQAKPAVRIAPNNPVFDLQTIVGIGEGLINRTYDWMKERGLSTGESEHAKIVVG